MTHTDLEIFVITNGRKTFPYVIKSLEAQSEKRKITVVGDMLWIDALNECVKLSKSDFYLRVDDDMFLHPHAVAYYLQQVRKVKKLGVYECKFWEDWSNKPAGSLKAYCTKVIKRVGFRPSKLGKVDKNFTHDLGATKFQRVKDKSMIGLHACASIKDQKRYRSLWRDKNSKISKEEFVTTFDNIIHKCTKTLKEQYAILQKIPRLNKQYKTGYHKFIRTKT